MHLRILAACAAAWLAAVPLAATETVAPAVGLDNPVLAFNVDEAQDWGVGMQFLDLMKFARPWIGHKDGEWGAWTTADLRDGGYLDDAGWVRALPAGSTGVGSVFAWRGKDVEAAYRDGRYVMRYAGTGKITFSGSVKVVSDRPGRIEFDIPDAAQDWFFTITQTDPRGTGDYIRDLSIVHADHMELYDAGAVFNPEWVRLVADAREIRFMQWQATNRTDLARWQDRPHVDGPHSDRGHAVEDMVRLANEIGADAWFTMPHLADDDFVRSFAVYVRDHLDPRLQVRVEWSNEVWNWAYPQAHWVLEQARSVWGTEDFAGYKVKKAVETALIWRDVFKDSPKRLRTVLAVQTDYPGLSRQFLSGRGWQKNEPDRFVAPREAFDDLAVTTYFGSKWVRGVDGRVEILDALRRDPAGIDTFLRDRLLDPGNDDSLYMIRDLIAEHRAMADEAGLGLILYEGGQHMDMPLRLELKGLTSTEEELAEIRAAMGAFVRSPEMAELYAEMWDIWAAVGDGPFMQYNDLMRQSRHGSWGLYAHLGDSTPRSELLERLNMTRTPWWDGGAGPQYLHGQVVRGTSSSETLVGTPEEDYVLAGGGDDVILASPGADGLHGGDGRDVVRYPGRAQDYSVELGDDVVTVTGEGVAHRLVGVEALEFASGASVEVTSLAR